MSSTVSLLLLSAVFLTLSTMGASGFVDDLGLRIKLSERMVGSDLQAPDSKDKHLCADDTCNAGQYGSHDSACQQATHECGESTCNAGSLVCDATQCIRPDVTCGGDSCNPGALVCDASLCAKKEFACPAGTCNARELV